MLLELATTAVEMDWNPPSYVFKLAFGAGVALQELQKNGGTVPSVEHTDDNKVALNFAGAPLAAVPAPKAKPCPKPKAAATPGPLVRAHLLGSGLLL